ncbi:MAG: NifU N-terminal domain-containing protein [Salinibacter sp.]
MIQVERTPNPNSLKFTATAGEFSGNEIVAISSTAEVDRHPLGERLFAIDGVADVFITPGFVTVSKEPGADWTDLRNAVEVVLTEYLEASDAS